MNELCRLSAAAAVELLRKREVSPLDLVDAAAGRIAETDGVLNAMPTLCLDRARAHAKRLMREPRTEPPAHYLYGLPIAVKDSVDVEGVRCTMGSPILADRISPQSDIAVQRLEAAGAIVIGKSDIPEFATGGNTFNAVFGITRNPWNVAVTPGGSSGGTAAALASGQVWLGTGNDFGGSIRLPSSFCSLVGLRPTAGVVLRIQKQPYSPLNVEGPMARGVADCALMLECEAGHLRSIRCRRRSRPVPSWQRRRSRGRRACWASASTWASRRCCTRRWRAPAAKRRARLQRPVAGWRKHIPPCMTRSAPSRSCAASLSSRTWTPSWHGTATG